MAIDVYNSVTPQFIADLNANFLALANAINLYSDSDNSGATGSTTATLPPLTAGLRSAYSVVVAQPYVIQAPAGVTIYVGEIASSVGGRITSSSIGSTVTLKAKPTQSLWVAETFTGSWTPS